MLKRLKKDHLTQPGKYALLATVAISFLTIGLYHMSASSDLFSATAAERLQMTQSTDNTGKYADRIQRVKSPKGIEAWLVEEHAVPLIALQFAFVGGSTQDPKGKEGLAYFLTSMLDEGAGDIRSKEFQAKLDEMAIRLDFDATRDAFDGSFQTLTRNKDEAVELLRLAINKPRFDSKAIERMRSQLVSSLKMAKKDPNKIASKAWFKTAFGDHPYARPSKGTIESMATINKADLEGYRRKVFAKKTLKVAVVGAISAVELETILDRVFGDLPDEPELTAVPEISALKGSGRQVIKMNNPQSVAMFGHRGYKRDHPDFIPAYVLNYILGGGGFSSRLMEEVREKRGLAYSVYSYLYPLDHGAMFMGGVATKNEAMETSIKVIKDELKRLADKGPSSKELENAQNYLTGSYPLRFDTSNKIASQLLWIQMDDLGIDYIDQRNNMVEAVTIEKIRKVASELIKPDELFITIVGQPKPGKS